MDLKQTTAAQTCAGAADWVIEEHLGKAFTRIEHDAAQAAQHTPQLLVACLCQAMQSDISQQKRPAW